MKELIDLESRMKRSTQALKAGAGLLSAMNHAVSISQQGGHSKYVDEARECEYEVDMLLDAIAERVADKIAERKAQRRRKAA